MKRGVYCFFAFVTVIVFTPVSDALAALQAVPQSQLPISQRDRYDTDIFTGSATYEYPIVVPAGTNGLFPDLSLSYSSLGALDLSSFTGSGWQLSMDYIERDTGFTPNNPDDDTFILNFQKSMQPLLFVASENRYHTKIESFLNIQKLNTNAQNTSGEYWQVITKDGTKYRFGFVTGSELWCEGRNYVRRWLLDQVEDTHGNKIFYSYLKDSGTAYPLKIEYNNDKLRVIDFLYQTNPSKRPIYPRGCSVTENNRLQSIQIKASGSVVRSFDLNYNDEVRSNTHTVSVTEKGSDGTALPATTFAYKPEIKSWDIQYSDWLNNAPVDVHLLMENVRLMDVTGDGLPDIISGQQTDGPRCTYKVWRNTGSTWTIQPEVWVNNADIDAHLLMKDVTLADANGDGLTDIVKGVQTDGPRVTWKVWKNTGSSWLTQAEVWVNNAPIDAHLLMNDVRLIDVNGDGLPDIVKGVQTDGPRSTWTVWKNTGNSWLTQGEVWINNADIDAHLLMNDVTLADANGDGLPDIVKGVQINGGYVTWKVLLNTGSNWSTQWQMWIDNKDVNAHLLMPDVTLADINGDHLPDIVQGVQVDGSHVTWKALLNTGSSWLTQWEIRLNNADIDAHLLMNDVRLADVNGDGLLDIVKTIQNGGNDTWRVWKNNGYAPQLISDVRTSKGGAIQFEYMKSTGLDNTGPDSVSDLPFPLWIVQKMKRISGVSGAHATDEIVSYSYADGLFDYQDREFRGFGQVEVIDPNETVTVNLFHQDDALQGKRYRSTAKDTLQNPFMEIQQSWAGTLSNGIYNVILTGEKKYTYDGSTVNPKITEVNYQYDGYGNTTKASRFGDTAVTGDENYDYAEFVYNPSSWIVDTVKHTFLHGNDDATKLQESWFYYDNHLGINDSPVKGDLTKEVKWAKGGQTPTTLYEYDSFGNKTKQTDPNGHSTQYMYGVTDATFTFPEKEINAKNQQSVTVFDLGTGNILSKTDPNGAVTSYQYDVFGRILKEIRPFDTVNFPTVSYQYFMDGTAPEGTLVSKREKSGETGTIDTYTFIDGLGRTIQTRTDSEDSSKQIVVNTFYNNVGLVDRITVPHLDSLRTGYAVPIDGIRVTKTGYDPIGRIISVTNPKGNSATTAYDHWVETLTDENGKVIKRYRNAHDRIIRIDELNSGQTAATLYEYDPQMSLTKITDAAGNTTTFTYDGLGRKLTETDPDRGTWRYEYDGVGNMTKQTDNRAIVTNRIYDELDRIKTIDYPTDTDVTYQYDTGEIGTLAEVHDAAGTVKYEYDQRLRKIKDTRIQDGITWITQYEYDASDRLTQKTNPAGESVIYSFNTQGEIDAVNGMVTNFDYDAFGKIIKKEFANTLAMTYTYNTDDFRLNRIHSGNYQDLNYVYDKVGNITSIADATTQKTQNFIYDDLNRLITAQESGGYSHAYEYNAIGNLTKFTDSGSAIDYTYGQNAGVHALTSSTETAPQTPTPTSTPTPTQVVNIPTPTPTIIVGTPTPTKTPTPTSGSGTELLTSGTWTLSKNIGAAEKDMVIPSNSLYGKTSAQITFNLYGISFGGGDDEASIVFVQNGDWRAANVVLYGQNGLNGLQTVTIPLTSFHKVGNAAIKLDPSQPVSNLHARFWKSSAFTVDVTSVKLIGSGASTPTLTPTTVINTPTQTRTPTPTPTVVVSSLTPTRTPTPTVTINTPTPTRTPTPPIATSTPTPSPGSGTELLTAAWTLSGNNGASEKGQGIASDALIGMTSAQITFNLHGKNFGGGDDEASIVFVQNGDWRAANVVLYGQNGLNGLQTVTIPLTSFHKVGNASIKLDPSQPVTSLRARFWNSSAFTVDVTSVKVIGSIGSTPTPTPTLAVNTPTPTRTPTPPIATSTPTPTATPGSGTELLTAAWILSGNNGASEKSQGIPSNSLIGMTSAQITFNLHGKSFGGGDDEASIVFVQNNDWRAANVVPYGQNGLNGLQTVTIPLTSFHKVGNAAIKLDPSQPVTSLRARFWNSSTFTVDITSVKVK